MWPTCATRLTQLHSCSNNLHPYWNCSSPDETLWQGHFSPFLWSEDRPNSFELVSLIRARCLIIPRFNDSRFASPFGQYTSISRVSFTGHITILLNYSKKWFTYDRLKISCNLYSVSKPQFSYKPVFVFHKFTSTHYFSHVSDKITCLKHKIRAILNKTKFRYKQIWNQSCLSGIFYLFCESIM